MKDYRFYEEFESTYKKRKNQGLGSVIAATTESHIDNKELRYEGFTAAYNYPNSPVHWTSFSFNYLRKFCKRIPEAKARQIHPELFTRLDA